MNTTSHPKPLTFREATREDLYGLVVLLQDDDFGRSRETPDDLAPYKKPFESILNDPNHSILVIEEDASLIGCVQISYLPNLTFRGSWRAQFEGVRIRSSRRRQGLGKRLMEEAVQKAKARGCSLIQLTSSTSRPEAIAFYESMGFKSTHAGMKLTIH